VAVAKLQQMLKSWKDEQKDGQYLYISVFAYFLFATVTCFCGNKRMYITLSSSSP